MTKQVRIMVLLSVVVFASVTSLFSQSRRVARAGGPANGLTNLGAPF